MSDNVQPTPAERGEHRRPIISPQTAWAVFGVVAALVAAYAGVNSYIDSRVEARLQDPRFLGDLSRAVRPVVVFDDQERILGDSGGRALLKSLRASRAAAGKPLVITIEPKEFLGVEPILESLDHNAVIRSERGKGLSWIFTVTEMSYVVVEDSPPAGPSRFRLEILR
jgi:hypothetical protein